MHGPLAQSLKLLDAILDRMNLPQPQTMDIPSFHVSVGSAGEPAVEIRVDGVLVRMNVKKTAENPNELPTVVASIESTEPPEEEDTTTHDNLIARLSAAPHTLSTHRAVRTSEEAAAVRGCRLESGAKAPRRFVCVLEIVLRDAP